MPNAKLSLQLFLRDVFAKLVLILHPAVLLVRVLLEHDTVYFYFRVSLVAGWSQRFEAVFEPTDATELTEPSLHDGA